MAETQVIAARLLSDLQRDYGLTREQAAGVVGNFMHESGGFNSLQESSPLVQGSRGGYGYAQWTGPRRDAFESFTSRNSLDPTSYEANYGFLRNELATNPYERQQFMSVRNAQTAEQAARLISQNYLRPGIPHMSSRINYANAVLGYPQGGGQPSAVAAIAQLAPQQAAPRRPGAIMSYAATPAQRPLVAGRPAPPMMAASAPVQTAMAAPAFATAFEKTAASGFGSDYRDPYSRSTSISSI